MIPNIGELVVKQSLMEAKNREKRAFRERRQKALDFYNGRSEEYTRSRFSANLIKAIPIASVNVTKRIVDRISMVYMVQPKRTYTREGIDEFFHELDHKMQRLERYTNLLDACMIKSTWREGKIEYDIIHDYEPHFADDPMKPVAYTYPLSIKSEVLDQTPDLFAYWDEENYFVYDSNGKIMEDPDNPEHINFYGFLPFTECWREGKPEYAYFDTEPLLDLVATNDLINVAETNKMANVHFQSFGYLWANGSQIDKDDLDVGQDEIMYLGIDGNLNVTSPPNSIPALSQSINDSYKMLALNYHLPASFVEGTSAESGVALRLRNQELQDERKSDLVRWQDVEKKRFEVDKGILAIEMKLDAGDIEMVDFNETAEVLSPQEQREKWEWELANGLIDKADILMQMNPDGFQTREDAFDYLFDRAKQEELESEGDDNDLVNALIRPV